ncbi:ArsR/SmtB family transcription factor [Ottowia sp. VDI28]|uniref:ArsR/SmtB family transcription factor n=1 Tax=Ottowia sp. VDI28 TaxID=3133968 RepID=UPI003C2B19E4
MNTNQIARIASLMGEPARTAMLVALMDGRALTAGELARAAHLSAATTSRHLALLVEASLLHVVQQGKHRYFRLSSPEVAQTLEGIMQLSVQASAARPFVGPKDVPMRVARLCYDHIAGRLGVAIAEALQQSGAIIWDDLSGNFVTPAAQAVLEHMGISMVKAEAGQARRAHDRPLCRPCLDWSERRMHVAGRLGAVICRHCLEKGWLTKTANRSLAITPPGAKALSAWLGAERWAAIEAPDREGGQ